jgi:putative ABC transport system ATP-binding protein
LHAGGQTILLVTHDDGVAAAGDRIVRMRDGRIVDSGDGEIVDDADDGVAAASVEV